MGKKYRRELDFVLNENLNSYKNHYRRLSNDPNYAGPNATTKDKIIAELKSKYKLDWWESNIIFEQLLLDGYIQNTTGLDFTLKGAVFAKNGGYSRQNRVRKLTTVFKVVSSAGIVVGTVLTAILSCFQYSLQNQVQTQLKHQQSVSEDTRLHIQEISKRQEEVTIRVKRLELKDTKIK